MLQRLFQEAQVLLPYARPAFLDAACGDDQVLREKLETLLEADAQEKTERLLADIIADLTVTPEPVRALRKEPNRRDVPVELFAQDIERHLDPEPGMARRRDRRSRFAKFLRRGKPEVTAAAVFVGGLLAGLGAALWQTRRHERAS